MLMVPCFLSWIMSTPRSELGSQSRHGELVHGCLTNPGHGVVVGSSLIRKLSTYNGSIT